MKQRHRRPIHETELLRLVDSLIFGEQAAKLAPAELETARGSEVYRMMQRVGIACYRAGERGLRPKPLLDVVFRGEKRTEAPEPTNEA